MKKNFSKVMLIAAAAIAFLSCQKSEVEAPKYVEVNGLSFSSEKPELSADSRTEWTVEGIQWSEGDKIRVAYTCDGVWQNADGTAKVDEETGQKSAKIYESAAVSEDGPVANFTVPGRFTGTAEGVYEFYGIYPSSLVSDADIKYAPSVTITIPTIQTPSVSSFDSSADVMASKSQSYNGIPGNEEKREPISLKWERMVAHGHLTLKKIPVVGTENIQSITLTANAEADMVGLHYLYLDTYNVVKPNSNAATNSITIDARNLSIDSEGNVTFWASFLPCTWTSLNVKVETDKATYTREIDLSSDHKTFAKNARNTLGINMATAERVVRASSALPFERDFSNSVHNQNPITELDGFTIENSVYNANGAIRLAKTDDGGSVTTLPLDLSQNFHVKVVASGWDDDELTLTVTAGDQSNNLTLVTSGTVNNGPEECTEYIINFQPVSNSASVTFTTETKKRCYIQKIQILEGHAELTPILSATNPGEMSADGGEGSFTYTLSNPKDGKTVSATKNVDWIGNLTVNQDNKTVSYTVAKNTAEDSREGTITLSYEGAQSVNVTVTQKGKTAEGDTTPKFVKVTTVPADWSGVYILGYTNGSTLKTLCGKNSGGNYGAYVDLTLEDQSILSSEVPNECVLTIESTTNGYSLNVNNTYLGYTSTSTSGNNNLWFNSSFESRMYEWTIKMDGENVLVTSVYNTNRVIKWNNASNGLRFACYTSSQSPIQLYKLMGGEPGDEEPKPAITVSSEASVNVEAAGATGTVSYTLTNAVADAKVSAQANQTWVTIGTITSTSVPFTVSENIGEQRTATITLSYDGAESKTVNITQAEAQSGGGETPEPEPDPTPDPEQPGESKTVIFNYAGVASNTGYTGETIDGVTLSGSNIATNKDGQLRVYANTGTFTLNAGSQAITKVELTFSGNYKGTFNLSGYSDGVWTGSQSEVIFKNTGSQARITKIVVTLN